MLRSPRNDARPRIARIGTVFSAAALAAAFRRAGSPAPPSRRTREHGKQHVEHGLLSDIGLSARLDRLDRGGKSIGDLFAGHLILQQLAERHEQRPVERAGRAADFHDEGRADALQRFAEVLGGELINCGQHGFKAAAHIGPVIAVADGAIEIGQFIGARDDPLRHGFEQQFAGLAIDHHACPRSSSAPIRLPAWSK